MKIYKDIRNITLKDDVVNCLFENLFFKELDAEQLQVVAKYMEFVEFDNDTFIFKEGDVGDDVFFIINGKLDVIKQTDSGDNVVIATLSCGSSTGEMSIIDNQLRSATIKTRSAVSLLRLNRYNFEKILKEYPFIGVILLKGFSRFLSLHLRNSSKVIVINHQKNELIGIAAHDLNNPLSAIMGFTSLIIDSKESNESINIDDVIKYLKLILQSSESMHRIITDLLDVNKIESGGITVRNERLRLTDVAEKVIDNYKEISRKKNINLHFTTSDVDYLTADKHLMKQVLENLVSNAIKYSPHGKTVATRIAVSDNTVRFEVQDDGPGISEEDQSKLFRKFTRLQARPTGGEDSNGLGLWIVKKLVEAMSGSVWCESRIDKGSTFIVEFERNRD
jgi:signal transduction histidine kinase